MENKMKDIIELLNIIMFDQDWQDNEYAIDLINKITKENNNED
tara:strand:+ start:332 stop:460 length:129 start_codon:yes stop_codon:yes gene_type:complete